MGDLDDGIDQHDDAVERAPGRQSDAVQCPEILCGSLSGSPLWQRPWVGAIKQRPPLSAVREPVLPHLIDAPRGNVFRNIIDTEVLRQSLTTARYTTPVAVLDRRVGANNGVMKTVSDERDVPYRRTYLEVVTNRTRECCDADSGVSVSRSKPVMAAVIALGGEAGKETDFLRDVRSPTHRLASRCSLERTGGCRKTSPTEQKSRKADDATNPDGGTPNQGASRSMGGRSSTP
jgi:uncharacterized protein YndB with AHSA1/START domain